MKTVQPRKQRVRMLSTPIHRRKTQISAHLSPDLRKKYETRSFPIRKGDTVKIVTGENKGKEGKISTVNMGIATVEGITRSKTDGTKVFVPIHVSNLLVTDLDLSDSKRKKAIERKRKTSTKTEVNK
jgi:large subunit ribosomal protein L24